MVDLRNDVIMQFLFVEERSTDQHGRELSYLVRDLTSEVGFFRTAGNISEVNVTVSYEHLFAAGGISVKLNLTKRFIFELL